MNNLALSKAVPRWTTVLTLLAHGAFSQPNQDSLLPPDSEIQKVLANRIDTYRLGVGMVVGIIEPQGRRIVAYGGLDQGDRRPLNGDTIFEIGSVTKVLTSLLLADMVQRGEVALADPVAKFLPSGVKVPTRGGRQITLQDLSTHTSGLPPFPLNLNPSDPANPFAEYSVRQLYEFLASYELPRDIGSSFEYSNVGVALLGHALERRTGKDYEALIRARITGPLGMASTRISLPAEMKSRLAVGHEYYRLTPVPQWNMGVFTSVGGIQSSANDLLAFLAANLGYAETPLAEAMSAMLKVSFPVPHSPVEIHLGWGTVTLRGAAIVNHNGGTYGFTSFIGYNPKARVGVVILANGHGGVGVDDIGFHLLNPKIPLLSRNALDPPKDRNQITVNATVLDGYVGRYGLSPEDVLTVTREDDQLFVKRAGELKVAIYPESNLAFFSKAFDEQVTFKTDAMGRATELTFHENGATQRAKRLQ